MKKFIKILIFGALAVSCAKEQSIVTPSDRGASLIGRAVNFDASYVTPYEVKATPSVLGDFSNGDRMTIFRQYWDDAAGKFDDSPASMCYRVYYRDLYNQSELDKKWVVVTGAKGKDPEITTGLDAIGRFTQTAADSLKWDNNLTTRFRGFCRSNYASIGSRASYYPDFSLSDWIAASGPTLDIPLKFTHLGSRIVISVRNEGNRLYKVEVCLDWEDYKRIDNNDTITHDEEESTISDALAQQRADAVRAVYERMCMPSGVNVFDGTLYAMDKTYYDGHSSLADVETEIHDYPGADYAHVPFGTLTPAQIVSDVQRPVFNIINNSAYFITIPYDFSSDPSTQAEVLTFPEFTRFKVYLYDVNNGDLSNHSGSESQYHIFCLSDIKDASNNTKYPNGLCMDQCRSYQFRVGYRYDTFTVTSVDDFGWADEVLADIDTPIDEVPTPTTSFSWWQQIMNDAAADAIVTNNYNPVFPIDSYEKFASFVSLVNGTATTKDGSEGIEPAYTTIDVGGTPTKVTGWYRPSEVFENDTTWLRRGGVDEPGFDSSDFIFYDQYHPQNGDVPAYVQEEYLHGPYPFYNAEVFKDFVVSLEMDLDLSDWDLTAIGDYASGASFRGIFNGNMHTIKNVNVPGGYIFDYLQSGSILNLKVESTHPTALVNQADGSCHIVGVSLKADSAAASLVQTVTGASKIVGCIHEGAAGAGLVGEASAPFMMYGCMQTSADLSGGALCSVATNGALAPQDGTVKWGDFMCCFYDKLHSPSATAVGGAADAYQPQEYIRGGKSSYLKAHADDMSKYSGHYGRAPFRAMNAAIYYYNANLAGTKYQCDCHFVMTNSAGYDNNYPQLVPLAPDASFNINIPAQLN